ncbi:MAG: CDP-diacylglycerol--glycerol-3-phosphate 3-phosphatidyltransferase [Erysipelotrichaceae bacterium]|nr:CDP-diacylglycerol--glycerol-3-phosphate 3-phosphatidyltransferase [Erysipelotrichaceae bacterium]
MNLPNRLTVLRILMIPIIVLIYLFPYAQMDIVVPTIAVKQITVSYVNIAVLVLFAIASFTDFLDGTIARKYGLITTFGKFADPIADKLLVNTMFLMFASKSIVPVVPVLLMLARDTIVDGCRMIASNNGVVVAAGVMGKAKTVLQMITIILVLANNLPFELFGLPFADVFLWSSAFVSVASGINYFNQVKDYILESK